MPKRIKVVDSCSGVAHARCNVAMYPDGGTKRSSRSHHLIYSVAAKRWLPSNARQSGSLRHILEQVTSLRRPSDLALKFVAGRLPEQPSDVCRGAARSISRCCGSEEDLKIRSRDAASFTFAHHSDSSAFKTKLIGMSLNVRCRTDNLSNSVGHKRGLYEGMPVTGSARWSNRTG